MRAALIAAVALAAAAAPAQAHAATFYVDDDSPGTPAAPCTSPPPAAACATINAALADARAAVGTGDVIRVSPGLYEELVELGNSAADPGTLLVGSGTGPSPATATIVRRPPDPSSAATLALGGSTVPGPANLVARNLRVEVPAGVTAPGVRVSAPGATLEDVTVTLLGTAPSHVAVSVGGLGSGGATIDGLTVSGGGVDRGIVANLIGPLLVRDSVLTSASTVLETGGSVTVQSSVLRRTGTAGNTVFALGGELTLDSTLVTGGARSLEAYAGFGATTAVTLRHVTLDPGAPKTVAAGDLGVGARADPSSTATVSLVDSIVLARQSATGGGTPRVLCASSDVPDQVQIPGAGDGAIDCPSAAGNSRGNSSSAPASLFVPALGDWRLAPGSAAVETGGATGLAAGESATDLAGNPRILDGDRDCVARRDKGAYELTGAAAACPAPARVPPEPAPAGGTVDDPPRDGADRTAPTLSRLAVRPRRFRVVSRRRARARRSPAGTRFAYRLSEDARVTFIVQRRASGRRGRGRCRRPSRGNRSRRRCVRWVRVARLSQAGEAGANRRRFTGRVRRRALRPGRRRVTVSARDAAGNRSRTRRAAFRIVRR